MLVIAQAFDKSPSLAGFKGPRSFGFRVPGFRDVIQLRIQAPNIDHYSLAWLKASAKPDIRKRGALVVLPIALMATIPSTVASDAEAFETTTRTLISDSPLLNLLQGLDISWYKEPCMVKLAGAGIAVLLN